MKKKLFIIVVLAVAVAIVIATRSGRKETVKETETETETITETETVTETTAKYNSESKLVALTFDDGPEKESTEKILRILKENDSVATFFVVGYNIDANSEVIKEGYEIGCEYGNHTKGHKYLTKCSSEELRYQIDYVNDKVEELTGERPKLCRAPGGYYRGVENQIGMPLIQWSVDTNDWKKKDASNKGRTEEQRNADIDAVVAHVLNNVDKGGIVLMHDIYNFTADVCAKLIPRLREEGYELVTVSEMFEAYGKELEAGKVYTRVTFDQDATSNTAVVEPGTYKVTTNGGGLNLRSQPDLVSDVITEIPVDTVLTVTESTQGWAKVTYEGQTGWVSTKYLGKE